MLALRSFSRSSIAVAAAALLALPRAASAADSLNYAGSGVTVLGDGGTVPVVVVGGAAGGGPITVAGDGGTLPVNVLSDVTATIAGTLSAVDTNGQITNGEVAAFAGAAGSTVTLTLNGASTATASVNTGTLSAGDFFFEASSMLSGTVYWTALSCQQWGIQNNFPLNGANGTGMYICPVQGFQQFRLRVGSGSTIGTNLGVTLTGTVGSSGVMLNNIQTNEVSLEPALAVDSQENYRSTYSATVTGFAPPASPTDVFTIVGSNGVVTRVTNITVYGTQTTAGIIQLSLIKRSAADTGGNADAGTAVPHDNSDGAASSVVKIYQVLPSALGAAIGTVRTTKVLIPAAASVVVDEPISWTFGVNNEQPIVLRSAAQTLAVNLGGTTLSGGSLDISITWTEDTQ